MKTHAVKENRILKSFDFVLIVLTMSFVTFMFLKSTVILPDVTNHSGTGTSFKDEFPVLPQKENAVRNENAAQETTLINAIPAGNAVNNEESVKAETKSVSMKSNAVNAIKGGNQSKAATVDQSSKITEKSKGDEIVPATDLQSDKSILEQWIKKRDEWEQK